MSRPIVDVVSRFWAKVDKQHGGCWIWTAARNEHGYGVFRVSLPRPRNVLAHRMAWELSGNVAPARGVSLCHSCDVPACVNPAHLFEGSQAVNCADAVRKGRSNRGERNGMAKLTEADVRSVRASAATETARQAATRLGVHMQLIARIRRNRLWLHVR